MQDGDVVTVYLPSNRTVVTLSLPQETLDTIGTYRVFRQYIPVDRDEILEYEQVMS